MIRPLIAAVVAIAASAVSPAVARQWDGRNIVTQFCGDRVCPTSERHVRGASRARRHTRTHIRVAHAPSQAIRQPDRGQSYGYRAQVVAHPEGCPRRLFCGCGVAVRVFGRPVRDLWLAANWRRFPSAEPGPGKVAWRNGHVFYIEKVIRPGVALAYDPNSGGGLTRLHPRSLAGYRVVDPRSRSAALRR